MSESLSLGNQLQNRHFSCSNCVFANISPPASGGPFGVWQVGCKSWRLDHYIEKGKAELSTSSKYGTWSDFEEVNSFYKLNSFCNMYRDYEWVKKVGKEGASHDELLLEAEYENKCSFGIVIEISDQSEDDLKKTVESIKNIEYEAEKLTVTFSLVQKRLHMQIYLNLVEELRGLGVNCTLVMHSLESDKYATDKDSFMESFVDRRSYICKIRAGQTFDKNMMSFVNYNINEKLQSVISFEDEENGVVFTHRGVVNKLYTDYQDYDLMTKEILKESITQKNYRKYETKK